jgi:hypothetical protein
VNNGRVTTSRALRLVAAGAAALVVGVGAWVIGGNAYAARREREAVQAVERTFGPRAAMAARYAAAETNAEAREAERLARAVGYDLSLRARGSWSGSAAGFSEKVRASIGDYVTAQLVRPDEAVSPPPPEAAATLETHRAALTTFEEFLASVPRLRWSCEPKPSADEDRVPNLLGHMQTQRLLAADALASAARGDFAAAAKTLEASWKLNDALLVRPELVSQLIAMAVGRLQTGVLRKVPASSEAWGPRLAAMGRRDRLIDALVLENGDPRDFVSRFRASLARGGDGGGNRLVSWLREPVERAWGAEYSEGWRREIAKLRDAPAFEAQKADIKSPRGTTEVILAIAIPNIRNSFERADRLALDAELTTKILRMKELRRAGGAWPPPSAEIAASRFPGLSWSYAPTNGGMTIALAGALPEPKIPFVLPTSFSTHVAAP